jgi:hypothetical protein
MLRYPAAMRGSTIKMRTFASPFFASATKISGTQAENRSYSTGKSSYTLAKGSYSFQKIWFNR